MPQVVIPDNLGFEFDLGSIQSGKIRLKLGEGLAIQPDGTIVADVPIGGNPSNDFSNLVTTSIRSNQTALALPAGSGWRADVTRFRNLDGITAANNNDVYLFFNVGTGDLRVRNLRNNAPDGNKIFTPNSTNYMIRNGASVYFRYDASLDGGNGAWHILANKP